jgi:hypothetical protein
MNDASIEYKMPYGKMVSLIDLSEEEKAFLPKRFLEARLALTDIELAIFRLGQACGCNNHSVSELEDSIDKLNCFLRSLGNEIDEKELIESEKKLDLMPELEIELISPDITNKERNIFSLGNICGCMYHRASEWEKSIEAVIKYFESKTIV